MTPPLPPISNVDPYTGEIVGKAVETTRVVKGDAQVATRSDLGAAQGGEPSDSQEWLRSLKKKPDTPGPCAWCGAETTRRIAVELRQIKGRQWGIVSRYECETCRDREISGTQSQ